MIEQVRSMNNVACLSIENGDYRSALDELSRGLNIVQSVLSVKPDHDHDLNKNGTHPPQYSFTACSHPLAPQREEMVTSEEDDDFIYRHAIYIAELPSYLEAEYLLSVILVFNMALAHHLLVLAEPQFDSRKRLEGALKLYELGFSMQMKSDFHMDMTYSLAMVNNCAHIFKLLNQETKAETFLSHMISSLMMMIENGEAKHVNELDGFLRNVSTLILKKAVAPAA